ncbi:hypothetical protein MHLP_00885 [Candidatus Mycoplasma haematolamae str. Purdue]|uniref:Ig-like domain-containing protein n=1 Tax=Mycoplasma haematolamae (strain Purdue) TaxID=1212765 RepID=I7C5H3_MYCHA|nr:hypothetical protein [Candidatus Mycoplasma haematolamae]AFO51757.1 hypothetical protein MHLP_00885 [Candidatus Mycoplasma haematolamae str. Purdue]
MLLRTLFVKVVSPALLATGTAGGSYYAYQSMTELHKSQSDSPSTASKSSQQLDSDSFQVSLSTGEGKTEILRCSGPKEQDKQHYNIALFKEDSKKAEIRCFSSAQPQTSQTLKPKKDSQEPNVEEEQEDTDPISNLSCSTFQTDKVSVFQCTVSAGKKATMTLEETGDQAPKIVFEIKES